MTDPRLYVKKTPPAHPVITTKRPDPKMPYVAPADVPAEEWSKALQRFEILLPLAQGQSTRNSVQQAAAVLELRITRCYGLIKRLKADPTPMALVRRQSGPSKGQRNLDQEVEEVIEEQIDASLSAMERFTYSELESRIGRACREKGLPPPTRKTITAASLQARVDATGIRSYSSARTAGTAKRPRTGIRCTRFLKCARP